MIDQRFFRRAGPFTLAHVAGQVGGHISHPEKADALVYDVAAPERADASEICVFSDRRYRPQCQASQALAVIVGAKLADLLPDKVQLVVCDPRLAYAQICQLYYPPAPMTTQIEPGAFVDATAQIGEGCHIRAGAYIGAGVRIGARCRINASAVLEDGVELGDDCRIGANCTISNALLGSRVAIAPGTQIGSEGFGFVPSPQGLMRIPQLGRVIIGDDVDIGNNCTIDRGALGDTEIGAGTKIDNLVHLAHNVKIGRYCIITAQVGIAGSSSVGDGTMIGGQAAIADHVSIGSRVKIVAQSGIIRDIPDGETVGGSPALPVREWHRQTVALAKLAGNALRNHDAKPS
ncbi:MAG: UDP-3-O-(3-hydroxymyristoyl)glucosamine N-acyltransferase [Rhizomicrobium sp.]